MSGIVFDSGGLIAVERGDRRIELLVAAAQMDDDPIIVPATALAQVIRNPARQVRLWRMILSNQTEVISLNRDHARAVGALLARSGTSDVVDAHVVVCAQEAELAIITSDPNDLRRLDPDLELISV